MHHLSCFQMAKRSDSFASCRNTMRCVVMGFHRHRSLISDLTSPLFSYASIDVVFVHMSLLCLFLPPSFTTLVLIVNNVRSFFLFPSLFSFCFGRIDLSCSSLQLVVILFLFIHVIASTQRSSLLAYVSLSLVGCVAKSPVCCGGC